MGRVHFKGTVFVCVYSFVLPGVQFAMCLPGTLLKCICCQLSCPNVVFYVTRSLYILFFSLYATTPPPLYFSLADTPPPLSISLIPTFLRFSTQMSSPLFRYSLCECLFCPCRSASECILNSISKFRYCSCHEIASTFDCHGTLWRSSSLTHFKYETIVFRLFCSFWLYTILAMCSVQSRCMSSGKRIFIPNYCEKMER